MLLRQSPQLDVVVIDPSCDHYYQVPPRSAPDVIKNSPLAGDAGWVSVDKSRLTHTRHDNVYVGGAMTAADVLIAA